MPLASGITGRGAIKVPQITDKSELLDAVNRHVISFFDSNDFSMESMTTWNCAVHSGKEYSFRGRGDKDYVQMAVTVTAYDAGSAVLNVFRLVGGDRELLESFMPCINKIDVDVREGLARALTKTGIITLPQVLQIRIIRDVFLNHIGVKDFLNLEATCQLMKDISNLREVDNGFWRKELKRKFDVEQKQEGSYRTAYINHSKRSREPVGSSLLIETRRPPQNPDDWDPLRIGPPRYPQHPRPLLDPFGNPLRDPFGRPDPFAGPEFGGPGTGNELFPSRAPRHPGPRGPPGFGPAGWPQFDGNDFI